VNIWLESAKIGGLLKREGRRTAPFFTGCTLFDQCLSFVAQLSRLCRFDSRIFADGIQTFLAFQTETIAPVLTAGRCDFEVQSAPVRKLNWLAFRLGVLDLGIGQHFHSNAGLVRSVSRKPMSIGRYREICG